MDIESKLLLDPSRPSWPQPDALRPLRVRIRRPQQTGLVPAVVLSHGTGGAGEDLDWLAQPLAEAGFLVASVDHHGNSYNDEYLVEGFAFAGERARDLSLLLDHLVQHYAADPSRLGAAGFSLGGYTTAALLGAATDKRIIDAVFQGYIPAPEVPEFPDMIARLQEAYSGAELSTFAQHGAGTLTDSRVKAGVLLAPAMGQLLDRESLAGITAPVLIRWGGADDNTPPESNAHIYLNHIPRATGECVGEEVGHYEFLADREDSTGMRGKVAKDAISFFLAHL